MKHTYTKTIDMAGLRQAVTAVAIAGAVAGWAVLARPEVPAVATTTTGITAPVAGAAPAGGAAVVSSVPAAPSGLRVVTVPPSGLRVVTAPPAPITTTSSSR
jgi:hypothetical protein